MLNISYGNRELTDLYFLYSKDTNFKDYVKIGIEPKGKFFAKEVSNYHTVSGDSNGYGSIRYAYLSIKTNANLNFSDGDVVYSTRDNCYWTIQDHIIADDGTMKKYSLNPKRWTTLNLIKQEE